MSVPEAETQIDLIAHAISAGDLHAADEALQELRPMLVSDRVDELLALKARIDAMTLEVRKQRTESGGQLQQVVNQRKAVGQYKAMGDLPVH
ncbi:MAG: hypothetical protein GKR90_06000 [Pseudomonadales bacterium]|nr:hypothetical protein [Pseudomonadales bacterium]